MQPYDYQEGTVVGFSPEQLIGVDTEMHFLLNIKNNLPDRLFFLNFTKIFKSK